MSAPPARPRGSFEDRARSVPYRRHYVVSVALCLAYYLCLVGALTAAVTLMRDSHLKTAYLLGGLVALSGVFWFLSFLKRRSATCPLCKGTPLLDSQAFKHQKAVRFFPLNYGTTNVVRIIARQQFRCHFCGTPYDLLKPLSPPRSASSPPRVLPPPELPPAVIPPVAAPPPQAPPPQGPPQQVAPPQALPPQQVPPPQVPPQQVPPQQVSPQQVPAPQAVPPQHRAPFTAPPAPPSAPTVSV